MPPWPARLLGSPPRNHLEDLPNRSTPAYGGRKNEFTSRNDLREDALAFASPALSTNSSSPRTSQHGRAHSHPFSPDGTHRGTSNTKGNQINSARLEVLDEHSFSDPWSNVIDGHQPTVPRGSPQQGDIDLARGKCATCDASMRWPRRLDVFRCSVCLMVNDLKPSGSRPLGDSALTPESLPAKSASVQKGKPRSDIISLAATKSIIDDCILSYLKERLPSTTGKSNGQGSEISRNRSGPTRVSLRSPHGTLGNAHDHLMQNTKETVETDSYENGLGTQNTISSVPSTVLPSSSLAELKLNTAYVSRDHTKLPPSRAPPPPPEYLQCNPCGNSSEKLETISSDFSSTLFRPLGRPEPPLQTSSEDSVKSNSPSELGNSYDDGAPLSELDAKTLLLGNFAENGMWWTGRRQGDLTNGHKEPKKVAGKARYNRVSLKTPRIRWKELHEWYRMILSVGSSWKESLKALQSIESHNGYDTIFKLSHEDQQQIEEDMASARGRIHRTLLKASENLLRRPGRPLKTPEDSRFLLILLANPLLNAIDAEQIAHKSQSRSQKMTSLFEKSNSNSTPFPLMQPSQRSPVSRTQNVKHTSIVKRILGLISNLPDGCHQHLINWFSYFSEPHFRSFVEFVGSFVTYRLTRQHGRKRSSSHDPVTDLVPQISNIGTGSSGQLHAALGVSGASIVSAKKSDIISYSEDWQIKVAAKVMSLLSSANNGSRSGYSDIPQRLSTDDGSLFAQSSARLRNPRQKQMIPTNTFYNSLLDYSDLISDFEIWESRRGKFSFCQYPMFLSIWAKTHIMEHDARRQMEIKAREAFFDSIISRKAVSQYLVLKVRRDCLVEDSLRGVSEVVGSGQEEVKKELRIEFSGEEGVDAGGLRKEWFLLLVREVFDPEHGLFIYDEESHHCYFNPHSFETSDQFFLIGVVLGLAIYNSTILDIALPSFAFRKLLASAPNHHRSALQSLRPTISYSLEDLAEYRPVLARGLAQLLDYEGNVEDTFCRNFVAEIDRYDQVVQVPLCPNGENRPVTNANRGEFVDCYVRYLLDISIARQFEPFKRGFFSICGGNALSLFQPDEIERLVRGSDEPLDVTSLRAVAVYDGWPQGSTEPVVTWFWDTFAAAPVADQRRLISFITASDRIPAIGATSLVIKLVCLSDDRTRFPIARTCFNMIGLYRYASRRELEAKLWRAVMESEGFGLR